MERHESSPDFIRSTIPESHDINPYVQLLKRDGMLAIVGALGEPPPGINNQQLAFHRRCVAGSLIGGIAETQEVLDFCAAHGIVAETDPIKIQDVNDVFDRAVDGDVRYRSVIDMASLAADRKS